MKTLEDTDIYSETEVPYSTGKNYPTINVPVDSCDCHHHIYDPLSFPYIPQDTRKQPPATVDAYRLLQKRLGTTRNVIVTPSAYGTDNRCTLDALKQMGENARAVVVINESITDDELQKMHGLGVRGIRFNIATGAVKDPKQMLTLSQRIHEWGWHVSFWMSAEDTVELQSLLLELPTPIVLDHRGHIPQPGGTNHPAFKVIGNLIEYGNAWVKLSGLYHDSLEGEPTFSDTVKVGKEYVRLAPERLVWGTDWPHPSLNDAKKAMPDNALMLDLLAEQSPVDKIRKQILVDNPAILYDFPK